MSEQYTESTAPLESLVRYKRLYVLRWIRLGPSLRGGRAVLTTQRDRHCSHMICFGERNLNEDTDIGTYAGGRRQHGSHQQRKSQRVCALSRSMAALPQ